ncbi:MAG TPA: hypothetical protein VLI68_12995 [Hanamia sp.]|jgi:hypothetical protein|nr:hypothetical protein [Hanamia sp.]
MSDCNFNIPFQEPVTVVIAKAKAAIESYNGTFNGDETSGDFGITIYGNTIKGGYSVTGQVLNLIITQKPFFVPCSTIENLLLKEISK